MKILVFFNDKGIESKRLQIPPFFVSTKIEYAYILWKYNKLRKKDPVNIDSWDTFTIKNTAENGQ